MKMTQFVKSSLAGDLHDSDNTTQSNLNIVLGHMTMNELISVFENLLANSVFQAVELAYIVMCTLETKLRNGSF